MKPTQTSTFGPRLPLDSQNPWCDMSCEPELDFPPHQTIKPTKPDQPTVNNDKGAKNNKEGQVEKK